MRTLLAALVFCMVTVWSVGAALSATLIETAVGNVSVWLLDDPRNERVLIASRGGSKLIDLKSR